ncbi:MAG: hypothetical protein ACOYI8_00055 [Christensenellales bacterium]|jgi:hypothetical protein
MALVADKLWIWGHPENSLKGCFGLTKESFVSPLDGMRELGAKNVFYIPMGRPVDRDARSAEMQRHCGAFGWSIENPDVARILPELKKKYPALSIGIFDDFLQEENTSANMNAFSLDALREIKSNLHAVGVEMWAVFYERDMDKDFAPYLSVFDGITFWFWSQPTPSAYEQTLQRLFAKIGDARCMLGCYLYDFGREKECDPNEVLYELTRGMEMLHSGRIEGIILHTNAVGGMDFDAYAAAARWVGQYGIAPVVPPTHR